MRKSLDERWRESKEEIINHLENGWSINMAFSKAGIHRSCRLFDLHYSNDQEFKNKLVKYRQSCKKGFVR